MFTWCSSEPQNNASQQRQDSDRNSKYDISTQCTLMVKKPASEIFFDTETDTFDPKADTFDNKTDIIDYWSSTETLASPSVIHPPLAKVNSIHSDHSSQVTIDRIIINRENDGADTVILSEDFPAFALSTTFSNPDYKAEHPIIKSCWSIGALNHCEVVNYQNTDIKEKIEGANKKVTFLPASIRVSEITTGYRVNHIKSEERGETINKNPLIKSPVLSSIIPIPKLQFIKLPELLTVSEVTTTYQIKETTNAESINRNVTYGNGAIKKNTSMEIPGYSTVTEVTASYHIKDTTAKEVDNSYVAIPKIPAANVSDISEVPKVTTENQTMDGIGKSSGNNKGSVQITFRAVSEVPTKYQRMNITNVNSLNKGAVPKFPYPEIPEFSETPVVPTTYRKNDITDRNNKKNLGAVLQEVPNNYQGTENYNKKGTNNKETVIKNPAPQISKYCEEPEFLFKHERLENTKKNCTCCKESVPKNSAPNLPFNRVPEKPTKYKRMDNTRNNKEAEVKIPHTDVPAVSEVPEFPTKLEKTNIATGSSRHTKSTVQKIPSPKIQSFSEIPEFPTKYQKTNMANGNSQHYKETVQKVPTSEIQSFSEVPKFPTKYQKTNMATGNSRHIKATVQKIPAYDIQSFSEVPELPSKYQKVNIATENSRHNKATFQKILTPEIPALSEVPDVPTKLLIKDISCAESRDTKKSIHGTTCLLPTANIEEKTNRNSGDHKKANPGITYLKIPPVWCRSVVASENDFVSEETSSSGYQAIIAASVKIPEHSCYGSDTSCRSEGSEEEDEESSKTTSLDALGSSMTTITTTYVYSEDSASVIPQVPSEEPPCKCCRKNRSPSYLYETQSAHAILDSDTTETTTYYSSETSTVTVTGDECRRSEMLNAMLWPPDPPQQLPKSTLKEIGHKKTFKERLHSLKGMLKESFHTLNGQRNNEEARGKTGKISRKLSKLFVNTKKLKNECIEEYTTSKRNLFCLNNQRKTTKKLKEEVINSIDPTYICPTTPINKKQKEADMGLCDKNSPMTKKITQVGGPKKSVTPTTNKQIEVINLRENLKKNISPSETPKNNISPKTNQQKEVINPSDNPRTSMTPSANRQKEDMNPTETPKKSITPTTKRQNEVKDPSETAKKSITPTMNKQKEIINPGDQKSPAKKQQNIAITVPSVSKIYINRTDKKYNKIVIDPSEPIRLLNESAKKNKEPFSIVIDPVINEKFTLVSNRDTPPKLIPIPPNDQAAIKYNKSKPNTNNPRSDEIKFPCSGCKPQTNSQRSDQLQFICNECKPKTTKPIYEKSEIMYDGCKPKQSKPLCDTACVLNRCKPKTNKLTCDERENIMSNEYKYNPNPNKIPCDQIPIVCNGCKYKPTNINKPTCDQVGTIYSGCEPKINKLCDQVEFMSNKPTCDSNQVAFLCNGCKTKTNKPTRDQDETLYSGCKVKINKLTNDQVESMCHGCKPNINPPCDQIAFVCNGCKSKTNKAAFDQVATINSGYNSKPNRLTCDQHEIHDGCKLKPCHRSEYKRNGYKHQTNKPSWDQIETVYNNGCRPKMINHTFDNIHQTSMNQANTKPSWDQINTVYNGSRPKMINQTFEPQTSLNQAHANHVEIMSNEGKLKINNPTSEERQIVCKCNSSQPKQVAQEEDADKYLYVMYEYRVV